ncbi:hypothetical protein BOX37_13775 [Nocardia mangyaensis]|uniref:Uncharacterized protein n=1 Tax=Nocardia mangyaensis TaxID=2213200 RepID=A0A1J0VS33_9NOCA|nr:hypothetical protein [Nocardia mangyaensis]APE34837.1 hypothetical protein BOX37_13775 [Nocardia mangyaensis]
MEQSDYKSTATNGRTGRDHSTALFPDGCRSFQVCDHVPTLSELVTTLEAMCEAGWITTAIERSDEREGA